MKIEAKIIADSINSCNMVRLTTFMCVYPRYIHSEIMTHRMLSKNSASSRAIPVAKLIDQVVKCPVIPDVWPKNEKGMSASQNFKPGGAEATTLREQWLRGRDHSVAVAQDMALTGLHKQVANRVIEPWMWITVLISGTDWQNFFALRAHEEAHPDFQMLAYHMLKAYLCESSPDMVDPGGWHMPFKDQMPAVLHHHEMLQVATARCARLSYMTHLGKFDLGEDYRIHDQLAERGHWSPFEHCAMATTEDTYSGNFRGWRQYRKFFPAENRKADLVGVFASIQALLRNQGRI